MWTLCPSQEKPLAELAINAFFATRTASLSSYKHCLLLHSRLASRVAKHDTILLIPCKILPVAVAQVGCDDWLSLLLKSGVCNDWLSLLLQTDVRKFPASMLLLCCMWLQDWQHPPFSGDVADGYVWGRGAMDIKVRLPWVDRSSLENAPLACLTFKGLYSI
jgi:hypothetical protein